MIKILQRIHKFFFVEIDPFIIGLFRFNLGFILCLYYFMLAPNWIRFYGPNGLINLPIKNFENYVLFSSVLLYVSSDLGLWLFYALCSMSSVALMFGWGGRFPIIWLWISNFSLMYRNRYVSNGEEQVLAVILFFSLFLPLNQTFRINDLITKERRQQLFQKDQKIVTWALKPFQIYIALIYLLSLPHKLLTDWAWRDGTVIYYSQMLVTFPRWPGLALFAWGNAIFSKILTLYTLIIEGLFPLLVWFKKFRLFLVLNAIALHTMLAVAFEGLMFFNITFLVGLILFLPSKRTKIFIKKWSKFFDH